MTIANPRKEALEAVVNGLKLDIRKDTKEITRKYRLLIEKECFEKHGIKDLSEEEVDNVVNDIVF